MTLKWESGLSRPLGKTRIGLGGVKPIPFHFSLKLFSSCQASGPSPGVHGPGYPGALIQVSAPAFPRNLVRTGKEGWDPCGVLLHVPEHWMTGLGLFLWYRHWLWSSGIGGIQGNKDSLSIFFLHDPISKMETHGELIHGYLIFRNKYHVDKSANADV